MENQKLYICSLFLFLIISPHQSFAKTEFTIYLVGENEGKICDFLEFSEEKMECREGEIIFTSPNESLTAIKVCHNDKVFDIKEIPPQSLPDLKKAVNRINLEKSEHIKMEKQLVAMRKQQAIRESTERANSNVSKFPSCADFYNYCAKQSREKAGNYYMNGCGLLFGICSAEQSNGNYYRFIEKADLYLKANLDYARCDQKVTSAPDCTRNVNYQSKECRAKVMECASSFCRAIGRKPSALSNSTCSPD
jgi:hypothetical protein